MNRMCRFSIELTYRCLFNITKRQIEFSWRMADKRSEWISSTPRNELNRNFELFFFNVQQTDDAAQIWSQKRRKRKTWKISSIFRLDFFSNLRTSIWPDPEPISRVKKIERVDAKVEWECHLSRVEFDEHWNICWWSRCPEKRTRKASNEFENSISNYFLS